MEFLLTHLLTNSAARHPANEALRMNGRGLSYERLDRLTNQVARRLQALGVQRGDRVGIYVHKSPASVIAIFGILKAGGVYVPLDPNAPTQRLAYITRDCGVRVILSNPAKLGSLAEFKAEGSPIETVVIIDETGVELVAGSGMDGVVGWESVLAEDEGALPPATVIETDLAYILYTSGSTGVPKGVMIAHRTIMTFVRWCRDTFRLTPADRVTSHAPLHFDLSTFDLFVTLEAGGTVVLVGETLSNLPVQLTRLLQEERITVTYLVPSILSLLVRYGRLDAHDLSSLRTVLFAGEVFPMKYLRRLVELVPGAAFYNLYGPTETNVCTYYRVRPEDLAVERGDRPVPIGRACENSEVFAVDEAGRLITEPGREGELWVRGLGVAQGYWGDREKTERVFVQNPFNALYPDMVYGTGDIVTLAEDRTEWIYVGRRDHMIKSRGYRIELGEIENVLYRNAQVRDVAVVAIPDDLLGNRIGAFVVLAEGSPLTVRDLECFCARQVPKYMIPERIELCDGLPRTSTGKTDRPALVARLGDRGGAVVDALKREW